MGGCYNLKCISFKNNSTYRYFISIKSFFGFLQS